MPLYEYRCQKCGNIFEAMQKFSDEPLKVHESCGGEVERLISAPALQFKGTGWYITDYAKSGSGSPQKQGGGAGDSSAGKNEPKPSSSGDSPASSTSSASSSSTTSTGSSGSSSSGSGGSK